MNEIKEQLKEFGKGIIIIGLTLIFAAVVVFIRLYTE